MADAYMSLTAAEIVVHRGKAPVLHGVSATAEAGRVVGLIGPNGSGKSTLLAALAGLLPVSAGTVTLDGAALGQIPADVRARRIGFLEQNPVAHWPLAVERLAMLGRLPHRAAFAGETDADWAAVAAALERADVTDFRHRPVTALSGGERMRVMLARVLAGEPDILLVDEPVSGLDPYHQLQVMELLRDLAGDGKAVLAVLHDLTLAARYCDRLILLHNGRVAADGLPEMVLDGGIAERVFRVAFRRGDGWVLPWQRTSAEPGSP